MQQTPEPLENLIDQFARFPRHWPQGRDPHGV